MEQKKLFPVSLREETGSLREKSGISGSFTGNAAGKNVFFNGFWCEYRELYLSLCRLT